MLTVYFREERAAVRVWSTLVEKATTEVSTGLLAATSRFVGIAEANSSALYILLDKLLAVVLPSIIDQPPAGAGEDYFKAFCGLFENALLRVSEREKKEKLNAPIARVVNMYSKMFVTAFGSEDQYLVMGFVQIWNNFCRHKKGNTAYSQDLVDTVSEMQEDGYDVITPKSFGKKRSLPSRTTPIKSGRSLPGSTSGSQQKENTATPVKAANNVVPDSQYSLEQRASSSTPLTRSQARRLRSGVPYEEVVGVQEQNTEKERRRRSSRKSRSSTPTADNSKDNESEEKEQAIEGGDTQQEEQQFGSTKDSLVIVDSKVRHQEKDVKKDVLVIEDSQVREPSLIPREPTAEVPLESPSDELRPVAPAEEPETPVPVNEQLPPALPLKDPEPELPAVTDYADVEVEVQPYDGSTTLPVVDEVDNNYRHPLEVEDDGETQPVEITADYRGEESEIQQPPEVSDEQMEDAPEPEAGSSLKETPLADSSEQQVDPQLDNDDPFVSDSDQPVKRTHKAISGEKLRIHTPSPLHATDSDDCNLIRGSGSTKTRSAPPKSRLLSAQSDEIAGPRLWNSPRTHGSDGRAGILGKYIGSFISSFRGQNERGEEIPSETSGNAVVSIKEFNQINENADYGEGFKRKRKRASTPRGEKSKKRNKNSKKSDIEEEPGKFKDDDAAFDVLLALLDKFDQDSEYVKQLDSQKRKQYQDMLFKRFSGLYSP